MAEENLLVSEELYISCGVEIGTQQKSADMKAFIEKVRNDGLYILSIEKSDGRIKKAAQILAKYEPGQILVVSARQYGHRPIQQFAKAIGAKHIVGRFIPGTLTNPSYEGYIEPEVLLVTDSIGDSQAVTEAVSIGLPVIGMCDTNNLTSNIDIVIPTNNKGRKALAIVYWLLAREVLKEKGESRFTYELVDFESLL